MVSGCCCKEVYRFPHITFSYSTCISSFLQQRPPTSLFNKKMFFVLIFLYSIYIPRSDEQPNQFQSLLTRHTIITSKSYSVGPAKAAARGIAQRSFHNFTLSPTLTFERSRWVDI